jgi:glyoxylase-like metal-dependent hydrolase (beta-lactamase superfamily II)
MTAMDAGPLTLAKGKLVAFATGDVTVPSTTSVFQHPTYGVILWDTGINDAVSDPDLAEAYWGPGIKQAFGAHNFTRDHAIDRQLDRLGIQPKDVRYVIYSHLHLDHAGGMSYFPNATHVVQRDELRYALFPDRWVRPVYCQNDFRDIHSLDVLEIDGDFDLFGDGAFRLVKAPGHAPGMQVLFVTLPNRGRFILGGDIGHLRDQYLGLVPMPWDWNCEAMTLSRRKMQQIEKTGVHVHLCHDAADFAALPNSGVYWD